MSINGSDHTPLSPADARGPITVTGLTNGQAHTITLKTQTSVGLSAPSSDLTFTPESGASPPNAPTNVQLTPGDKKITVTFTPGFDNGAAITNYEYQINNDAWTALSPASTSNSFSITGLENGEAYTVSVRAVNAKGSGANSSPVSTALAQQKLTIFNDEGLPIELEISAEAGNRSGFNCSIVSAALTPVPAVKANVQSAYPKMYGFTLDNCKPHETVDITITLGGDPPANSITYKYTNGAWRSIEGATIAGREIRYKLTDNGLLDDDDTLGRINDPVAVAVPTGKPDAPYDLSATGANGGAYISFSAGNDHGNAITNYLYSTNGVDYIPLDPADPSSPITVPGLTNGEAVSVRLKARNIVGDSPPSEPVLVLPRVIPVPIPSWVLGLLATLMGWLCYRRLRLA